MTKGGHRPEAGSLDMLLDTMCNTFGGVCFIALMVAILSAMLPKGTEEVGADVVTEQMLVNQETAQLVRRRDELKEAVKIQQSFTATNAEAANAVNLAALLRGVSSNEMSIASLKSQKREFEDALASLNTDSEYSKREAARLARLLKELEAQLGKTVGRQRSVRTPTEREVEGLRCEDFWLHKGRLYLFNNRWQVKRSDPITGNDGKRHWEYSLIKGKGYVVGEAFFFGQDWLKIKNEMGANGYVRIFTDRSSFPQLCELRDALIYFKKMYNWHIAEEDVLTFVEGYDGRVQ